MIYSNKSYYLYEHVFPNGKKYIGITSDIENRWQNGNNYKNQRKVANAINHYGWENIKHNIIVGGLDKDQAEKLEEYLIAELHTIENGYNTTIGGDRVAGTYLDTYLLDMIRTLRKYPIEIKISFSDGILDVPSFIYENRYEKEISGYWNEATRAVSNKHRIYSTTDERDVREFWWHLIQYYQLTIAIKSGEDVSNWEEESLESYLYRTYCE